MRKKFISALLKKQSNSSFKFETTSMRIIPLSYYNTDTIISNAINSTIDSTSTIINVGTTKIITMNVPSTPNGGVFTYEVSSSNYSVGVWNITSNISYDSTNGVNGLWQSQSVTVPFETYTTSNHLQSVEMPISQVSYWLRVSMQNNDTVDNSLINVGCRHYSSKYLDDIWVVFGASIMEDNIVHHKLNTIARTTYNQDPLIFNRAYSGKRVDFTIPNVSAVLPTIPRARFLFLHIGGNDVSAGRPYATSSQSVRDTLSSSYRGLVNDMISSNKVPIISRLTFRNYPNEPNIRLGTYAGGLPEYGSAPYNENIIDPIIKDLTPNFYNKALNIPMMDLYTATLNDQSSQSIDGVHYNASGPAFWAELFKKSPMLKVYNNTTPLVLTPILVNTPIQNTTTAVVKAESTKLQEDVNLANTSINELKNWLLLYSQSQVDAFQARVNAIVIYTPPVLVQYNFDFGPGTSSSSNWNKIATVDQGLTPVFDSQNQITNVRIAITTPFGSLDSAGGIQIVGETVPFDVMNDNVQLQSWKPASVFELAGLSQQSLYTLKFYSAKNNTSGYKTTFTINGVAQTVTSSNNTTTVISFNNIVPDANNKIIVTVSTGGTIYAYLNAMVVLVA